MLGTANDLNSIRLIDFGLARPVDRATPSGAASNPTRKPTQDTGLPRPSLSARLRPAPSLTTPSRNQTFHDR